jgi:hypothetical protein
MLGLATIHAVSASLLITGAPSVVSPLAALDGVSPKRVEQTAKGVMRTAKGKSLAQRRAPVLKQNGPTHSAVHRPLDQGEFAELENGAPAASITIDLPSLGPVTIEVVRTSVVTDDFSLETAQVVRGKVVTQMAPIELPHAYAGRVRGAESSSVYLGFGTGAAKGLVAGMVIVGDESWWISSGPAAARDAGLPAMIAHRSAFANSPLEGLSCGAMALAGNDVPPAPPTDGGVAGGPGCREFRIAIETDTEFTMTAQHGNAVAAAQYALLLMGAASQVYDRDVSVKLPVSYLRIWAGEDIWTGADMFEQIYQYRDHWVKNMGDVERDIGHFFAGRSLGGGVAALGVACMGLDWSYALSSNIGNGFPYPLVDHSNSNWEPLVVNHELGHNFGAPHTGEHTPQADTCGTNDCSQAYGGTIMSSCHLCPGGYSNLVMSFHPFSIASMQAHLANVPCGEAGARAVDDAATSIAGTPVEIKPLQNDAFVNCSAVTLRSFTPTSVAGGTVSLVAGSAADLRYTPPAGFSGTDTFTYTIEDDGAAISTATVHVRVHPMLQRVFVDAATAGTRASWYALAGDIPMLPDFAAMTPYGSAVLGSINILPTSGNFSSSGRANHVAAVFEGYLRVPSAGLWKLSTSSNEGSRLLIGNQVVVLNDGIHSMVERFGEVALEAGLHPFRVEFFENTGSAGLLVAWEGPGTARAIIPASAYSHGGTPMALDLDGDGTVGAPDLAILLSAWGPVAAGTPADFNRDGAVDAADLSTLLSNWGL